MVYTAYQSYQVNPHFLFVLVTFKTIISFVAYVANRILTFPRFAYERKSAIMFVALSALLNMSTVKAVVVHYHKMCVATHHYSFLTCL
jgi:hypothetical protein